MLACLLGLLSLQVVSAIEIGENKELITEAPDVQTSLAKTLVKPPLGDQLSVKYFNEQLLDFLEVHKEALPKAAYEYAVAETCREFNTTPDKLQIELNLLKALAEKVPESNPEATYDSLFSQMKFSEAAAFAKEQRNEAIESGEASGLRACEFAYFVVEALRAQRQYAEAAAAQEEYAAALDIQEDPVIWATVQLSWEANVLNAQAYEGAENRFEAISHQIESHLGQENSIYVSALINQAQLYKALERYEEAIPLLKQVLKIDEARLGSKHSEVASDLLRLGQFYHLMRRYDEAEPVTKQAVEVSRSLGEDELPNYAFNLDSLAGLYIDMERYDEAEVLSQEALTINEELLGPKNPDIASNLATLALIYGLKGQYEQAVSLHKRSMAIKKKLLITNREDYAVDLRFLATLYTKMGQTEKVEPLLLEALAINEQVLPPTHLEMRRLLEDLASHYQLTQQMMEGEPYQKRLLEIYTTTDGPQDQDVAVTLNNLALIYFATGRNYKARQTMDNAVRILIFNKVRDNETSPYLSQLLHDYLFLLQQFNLTEEQAQAEIDRMWAEIEAQVMAERAKEAEGG